MFTRHSQHDIKRTEKQADRTETLKQWTQGQEKRKEAYFQKLISDELPHFIENHFFTMTVPTAMKILMVPLVVVALLPLSCLGISNEVDYGNWNYREGAENVNVANIRSVTRILDAWGKRIFKDIKTLLHSQPSALLPDYSREVSHLQRRITDLNNRLATLEPFLRHHGYREEGEDGEESKELPPLSMRAMGPSQAKYPRRYRVRVVRPVNRVVRTRRVRVFNNENGKVKTSESER
ncbi:uncharacterized protein LOC127444892 isoform X2 [Myxocyprinus asiaticus]|uniref:uncharacterized protein LOC127444892 isoform X2 n=1 Tax=Myxocyprinus asiaticus TaxID=70543 RepID=UPI0022227A4E|nr:uncharacterized protein LOC127444892 isoform X2 [Myxocyprinus asiaticus]